MLPIFLSLLPFLPLYYGVLFRMHGGMPPHIPFVKRLLTEFLIALPIGFLCYLISLNLYVGVAATVSSLLLKKKGHGQYFNLTTLPPYPKRIEPEDIDVFVSPFFGTDPRTKEDYDGLTKKQQMNRVLQYGSVKLLFRNLWGLVVSGGLVFLPLSLTFMFYLGFEGIVIGTLLFLSFGFLKAGAYAFSFAYLDDYEFGEEFDEATEWGELGTGLVSGFLLTLFYFPVIF